MNKKIFGIVPIKLNCDKRLNGNDIKVYVALASFQGKKESCFPSLKKISERCGIHKNHIPNHTKKLEECGYIEKIQRGKRISNVYRIVDNLVTPQVVDEGEYTETANVEYTKTANSEYTKTANSNIKTTIKTKLKILSSEEEVIFKNEYFIVTTKMIEEWLITYPNIKKFRPELTRVSDIIKEKEQRGEIIKSPMGFLHHHLKTLNKQNLTGGKKGNYTKRDTRIEDYHREGTSSEPKRLGDILKSLPVIDSNE